MIFRKKFIVFSTSLEEGNTSDLAYSFPFAGKKIPHTQNRCVLLSTLWRKHRYPSAYLHLPSPWQSHSKIVVVVVYIVVVVEPYEWNFLWVLSARSDHAHGSMPRFQAASRPIVRWAFIAALASSPSQSTWVRSLHGGGGVICFPLIELGLNINVLFTNLCR